MTKPHPPIIKRPGNLLSPTTASTMPSVTIHLPNQTENGEKAVENPLPQLLRTPSGLAILEIQGTINLPKSAPLPDHENGYSPTSIPVGRITFPNYHKDSPIADQAWMKTVHMYVGRHQRLTGEVKKLSNPIALIRKKITSGPNEAEELEIAEIISYKILFSSRPEPVGD